MECQLVSLRKATMGIVMHPSNIDTDRRAPIRWSSDNLTVERVLRYAQREYHAADSGTLYDTARRDILARIIGNLQNCNHRAYNGWQSYGEISYATVAREGTRNLTDKDKYLSALDSEWNSILSCFAKNFLKILDPNN